MNPRLQFLMLVLAIQTQLPLQGPPPSGFSAATTTEHFAIFWRSRETPDTQVEEVKQVAEKAYGDLGEILGVTEMPRLRIIIQLEGDAELGPVRFDTPHVDGHGRIHLYRYGRPEYTNSLPHELIHAIRRWKRRGWDGFSEEGLATYLGLQLASPVKGYPLYGFSLDLAAGQWLDRQEAIPLTTLRDNHQRLNLRCKAQAYTLRGSFFTFLGNRFGREAVLALADPTQPPGSERYQTIFGSAFEDLEALWKTDLRERFARIPNAGVQSSRYRKKTPVAQMPVCLPGTDF